MVGRKQLSAHDAGVKPKAAPPCKALQQLGDGQRTSQLPFSTFLDVPRYILNAEKHGNIMA